MYVCREAFFLDFLKWSGLLGDERVARDWRLPRDDTQTQAEIVEVVSLILVVCRYRVGPWNLKGRRPKKRYHITGDI